MNRLPLIAVFVLFAVGLVGAVVVYSQYLRDSSLEDEKRIGQKKEQVALELTPEIEKFCADCHVMPRASSFPKSSWQHETQRGFEFYENSKRTDLEIPDFSGVYQYFRSNAPDELDLDPKKIISQKKLADQSGLVQFQSKSDWMFDIPMRPTVANVNYLQLKNGEGLQLVYTDMRDGDVGVVNIQDGTTKVLATLENPAHSEACDLDGDGKIDLVIGDLGSFLPEDHGDGRVVFLRAKEEGQEYESIVLKEGVGRVCDVQPGDFDGDGDLDLLVAEFGWLETGSVFMLVNEGTNEGGKVSFKTQPIDPRHGCINVAPVDLNDDGHLDFVALFSQEHESVDAFINDGKGNFTKQVIFGAPDPAYGSSGITLVDLDQDGDQDLLYSNGDSFDSFEIKPFHSIQWLENTGNLEFKYHHIAAMPGVHKMVAADFDGDNDNDIVAVSLLPNSNANSQAQQNYDSIAVFLNDGKQSFSRFALEVGACFHTSCFPADFDSDGDIDLAVGTISVKDTKLPVVNVWWNQTK